MPNWCLNRAVISNKDPLIIRRIAGARKNGVIWEKFLPSLSLDELDDPAEREPSECRSLDVIVSDPSPNTELNIGNAGEYNTGERTGATSVTLTTLPQFQL
jgi:hypothetical protein